MLRNTYRGENLVAQMKAAATTTATATTTAATTAAAFAEVSRAPGKTFGRASLGHQGIS